MLTTKFIRINFYFCDTLREMFSFGTTKAFASPIISTKNGEREYLFGPVDSMQMWRNSSKLIDPLNRNYADFRE